MISQYLALLSPLLAVLSSAASTGPVGPNLAARWPETDQYGGKKLTPTNYSVVTGVFIQDSPTFNATGYNLLNDSFGLIDKSPNRWKNLTEWITSMNQNADEYTTYKLIYIARHGEGYHNLAQNTYGTPAWNCYWSLLTTDGNITWGPDALLDSTGIAQAEAVNAGWKQQIQDSIPLPETLYSSPMRRSASTLNITWSDILLNQGYVPYIKEGFRESIGLHTCDKRSNKTVIAATYPGWHFDADFTQHDELWDPIYEEQSPQQARRTRQQLNAIFSEDPSTFISITAHSGTITGFFTAVGHQQFGVQTGGFVPVIVKAVSYPHATMAVITGGQSGTAPVCLANPTTAVVSPASASVAPTWYPNCTTAPNLPITTMVTTGCLATSTSGQGQPFNTANPTSS